MPVESIDDICRLAQSVDARTRPLSSVDGTYLRWTSACGAELWLQTNKAGEFLGINPHFAGPARMKVQLTAYLPSTTPSVLDGGYHGWADPTSPSTDDAQGAYPFVFDAPDASIHRAIPMPTVVEVQIAAFAHEVTLFESEDAYDDAQADQQLKYAAESFIPSGLFGGGDESKSHGIFTGKILASESKVNSLTGHPYWWIWVQSLGGQFDVVADPELIAQPIVKGGILQGSFWLSGRILSPSPATMPARAGFWSTLFGKRS